MLKPGPILLAALVGCSTAPPLVHQAPAVSPSAAYRWVMILQEAAARDVDRHGPRPTVISREMAIVCTAMYDAWAAYDARAIGTRLGASLRRPETERTPENASAAVIHAAHRALVQIYPKDRDWIDARLGDEQGLPAGTPAGVGRAAADAVLAYRRGDGSNSDGSDPAGSGTPYSDTTGYRPRGGPFHWEPIPFDDGRGGTVTPPYLTPHWGRVKPFVLERADQFRPGPPPGPDSAQLRREVEECVERNASLSLEEKAIVEFMRDGPRSTGQSGHWLHFAADVSRRDGHDLERDVKLFFSVANIVFDAFISCWEAKRHYDTSRPWTLVRHYYRGRTLMGYLGPCKGFGPLPAERWHPYSPSTFVTPPFPGYPSGHAQASGAASRILEHFTGSDRFGAVARRRAGELTEAGCSASRMQAVSGIPAALPGSVEVSLELPTFSAVAEMAALSRLLGGYHIRADNEDGLAAGRRIADWAWPRIRAYFEGTASVRD